MCNRNVPGIKNMMTVTGDPRMKANCSLAMFAHLKISARLHKALRMAGSMTNFAAAVSLLLLFVHPGFRHQALAQTTASQGDFLQPQNVAPADVGVGKLSWDSELAAYAHRYAERRSHDCALVHSRGPYGENIYRGSAGGQRAVADAVAMWVEERQGYDCERNRCARRSSCAHYTQVVWARTKRVGCAAVECRSGGTFVICSYDPPGNMDREAPYRASGRYRVAAAQAPQQVPARCSESGHYWKINYTMC
jgi:pathogenesis-related protein 1